ncbi:MAG: acyl--CoA ligase [Prevotella sp.]|nr:acyl--CoA ligase [Prevotella sp.]
MMLENYLAIHAKCRPQKTAIVCGEEQCTYRQLYERVTACVEELRDRYPKGGIVCLHALPAIDYLVNYFALHLLGCVVAPLEKELPEAAFLAISRQMASCQAPPGTADILYTTGTTGQSKGVIVSHRAILADAENLVEGLGFSPELVFVVNGPLNHIGSLSKIYPVILLGATLIMVDGLKDLNRFYAAFDYPATRMATFLVPASIRILMQLSADRLASYAQKIDFIETGAAAISQADMQQLCRLLPYSRLYNTYASTETGIISTYNFNDGQCLAGCLGKPMRHSEVVITPQGFIACKGDTLMSGYLGDEERTAQVLRDGLLYTSDLGMLDSQGRLHLKGREDDVINVGGFKVAPTEVEDAALASPLVQDCICIAVDHRITGSALKLLVVVKDGQTLDKRVLAAHLKTRLETYKIPLLYEQVDTIHRTFNGKIDRKYYRSAPVSCKA